MGTEPLARLRLMQLVSPALPVGAFAYSQGLEWAVHAGWVTDEETLTDWLRGLVDRGLAFLDLPVLVRLYRACEQEDRAGFRRWAEYLLAGRETRELRDEEGARAKALTRLLVDLDVRRAREWRRDLELCQAGAFAVAAAGWRVPVEDAGLGYAFAWLESQVAAAVKLIPLGQTAGQRAQLALAEALPEAVAFASSVADEDVGACAPAQAIASSLHETLYTRLFRS